MKTQWLVKGCLISVLIALNSLRMSLGSVSEHTCMQGGHSTLYLASGPENGPLVIFVHGMARVIYQLATPVSASLEPVFPDVLICILFAGKFQTTCLFSNGYGTANW